MELRLGSLHRCTWEKQSQGKEGNAIYNKTRTGVSGLIFAFQDPLELLLLTSALFDRPPSFARLLFVQLLHRGSISQSCTAPQRRDLLALFPLRAGFVGFSLPCPGCFSFTFFGLLLFPFLLQLGLPAVKKYITK